MYERLLLVIVDAGQLLEDEPAEKLGWMLGDLRDAAETPHRTVVFLDELPALRRLAARVGEELLADPPSANGE